MNFKKIGIVISHEYAIRVRKKSFILTTLLTPLLMGLLIVVPSLIMLYGGNEKQTVKIVDESRFVSSYFENSENVTYETAVEGEDLETIKEHLEDLGLYAVVHISAPDESGNVTVDTYSKEPLNVDIKSNVKKTVSKAVEERKLVQYDIKNLDEILADVKTDVKVNAMTLTDDGKAKEESVEVYMGMAYVMSFLIYIFVFMFGTMVMRSVIDEKSSRVVEVIVSSVKTVDLMIGKIVGVALVALTQFLIWVLLTVAIVAGANAVMGPKLLESIGGETVQTMMTAAQDGNATLDMSQVIEAAASEENASTMVKVLNQLGGINWGYIIFCFLAYFLLGYLLYASMFAAIGAAVDNETDTSQLQLPVTIPLMLGLFIMLHTFEHPSSQLSFWASIIPYTSPMVMLARIPFGTVPGWQLALSLVLLLVTFVATAYFAAKIYKAGILMYGKKSTFKDLWKWMKQKD